jgi:hypothetical protein
VYWIEERDLEGIPADRPPLPLHPFAIVDPEASPEEAGETGDVLLFDAFTDKEILYDCRRGSAKKYATSGILRDDFLTAVSPLLASNGQLVGMPREIVKFIKPYAARLGERTQAFLKREKQKTYRPELQVPRRDTESKVAKFLESDKAALLVSGPSGIGKTCFVCRFAEERQKVDDSPTLVLLLAADSLPQSDISLERAVREILDPGKTVREWIADARRRFPNYRNLRLVVIVDGTDKHPSIANVLHAVDQWVRNTAVDMPELKLIATSRPSALAA